MINSKKKSLVFYLLMCAVVFSTLLCGSAFTMRVSEVDAATVETNQNVTSNTRNADSGYELTSVSNYVKYEEEIVPTYALYLCKVVTTNPSHTIRLSNNGIFVPSSSGSLWYTGKSEVLMTIEDDGFPKYRYAAAYSGDTRMGTAYLEYGQQYNPPAFLTYVTRDTASYIPTAYDVAGVNIWNHNGRTNKTIFFTILYNGVKFDNSVEIPWLGTNSVTINTGEYIYQNSEYHEVVFYVRTGPNRISIKANYEISLVSTNAFAFRLAYES